MSRSKDKGQGHWEQKKRKAAESSPLTMHNNSCAVGRKQQAAADGTTAWPPGGDGMTAVDADGYADGKISAWCLVNIGIFFFITSVLHTVAIGASHYEIMS